MKGCHNFIVKSSIIIDALVFVITDEQHCINNRTMRSKFILVRPLTLHNKTENGMQTLLLLINSSSVVEKNTSVRRGWVNDSVLRL